MFVVEANTSVLAFAPMAVVASRASRTQALALSHHGPGHSGKLVGKRDGGDLSRSRANSAVSQGRCLVPWILARLRDLGGACGLAQANGHRRIRVAGNGDRNWRRNASGRSARMAQPPSGPPRGTFVGRHIDFNPPVFDIARPSRVQEPRRPMHCRARSAQWQFCLCISDNQSLFQSVWRARSAMRRR